MEGRGQQNQSLQGRGSEQQNEEGEECSEQSPLLAQEQQQQHAPAAGGEQEEASAPAKPAAPSSSKVPEQQGQCRICLEEDAVSNLEAPCGCTGTQQFTHKACLQRWINEKHDGVCEVCKKAYEGSGYVVPPPPPPQQPAGEALHLVAPGLGSLYLTVEDGRGLAPEHQLLGDALYDDWDDHRQPTVSWCFSFMMFLLFMMFLHSSMTLSVPADGSSASGGSSSIPGGGPAGAAGGGMVPPGTSPAVDPAGGLPPAGAAAAGFAAGASLLFLWLLTKLFLVVLPLLMVMRLAARAQEQAAEAAAAAAVSGLPGRDVPVAGGGASGMSTRQFIARLAGRSGSASGGSTMADLELEVVQARRAALSRLGRDATFWAPAASAGAGGEAAAAGSASRSQQQQEEQRMIAAMRAMVRAAILNAQREMGRGAAAAGAGQGSGDGPHTLRGVV